MIPHMLLPKGTVIQLGSHPERQASSHGLHILLDQPLDYRGTHFEIRTSVVHNPNGWNSNRVFLSKFRDDDTVFSLPNTTLENQKAVVFLQKGDF